MGYWLGRLAVPGTLIPALDQTRQFPCVHTRTKSEKATVKASPAFLFQCLRASQWNDLFERVFHSPALFSILLAEAAEMTAVMLVTKMHLHSALTLYQNDQQAFHLSNSLLGTDSATMNTELCSNHSHGR